MNVYRGGVGGRRDFLGGSGGKEFAHDAGDAVSIPDPEDPLEKEMATHSSILAWGIPHSEESDGL